MPVTIQREQDSTWVSTTPPNGGSPAQSPLVQDPTVTAAPRTAGPVSNRRKDRDRRNADGALEHLVQKAERLVRDGLCEHLKHCPFLPPTTAHTLARDLATVTLPTADYAKVLAKSDLIGITRAAIHTARATEASKGPDIAGRDADAAVGSRRAPPRQLKPAGATEAFWDNNATLLRITERLVARFAAVLRGRLITAHGFPPVLVDVLILHGRERALCEAVGPDRPLREIEGLVQRLQARHALGSTFLFRALCAGQLSLFEASLAALAGRPIAEVRIHTEFTESRGFRVLYKDSGLPLELFAAFRIALGVVAELGRDRFMLCRVEADERIIQYLVQVYHDLCLANMETVHALLARRVAGQQPDPTFLSGLDSLEHPDNPPQWANRQ